MSLEQARLLRDEINQRRDTLASLRRAHREAERGEMQELRELEQRYRSLLETAVDAAVDEVSAAAVSPTDSPIDSLNPFAPRDD